MTPIQAGVSAILIIAFGPATTGSLRMIDVAVGVAVGLIFNQALVLSNAVEPKVVSSEGPD